MEDPDSSFENISKSTESRKFGPWFKPQQTSGKIERYRFRTCRKSLPRFKTCDGYVDRYCKIRPGMNPDPTVMQTPEMAFCRKAVGIGRGNCSATISRGLEVI